MQKTILSLNLILIVSSLSSAIRAQGEIRIATWNLEHLGSAGRGLGGIGEGSLGDRTENQLKDIANLIKNDLQADVLCMQEVAITLVTESGVASEPLKVIKQELGDDWKYYIGRSWTTVTPDEDDVHNIHCAFLWNSKKVSLHKAFELTFANEKVGEKRIFDRKPLMGYFDVLKNGDEVNDLLLVNVHLTSGQDNDENHLAALVVVEQNINAMLAFNELKESDRIILGDFNDNPFAKKEDGTPKYSNLAYEYMASKKYQDLVNASTGATRMDNDLKSIFDHVLVNNSAANHMSSATVSKYMPPDSSASGLATWRKTYSDHFPLLFKIKVENSDDDVD